MGKGKSKRNKPIGRTSGGVTILRPVSKPVHFTMAQARRAVRRVIAAKADG